MSTEEKLREEIAALRKALDACLLVCEDFEVSRFHGGAHAEKIAYETLKKYPET